MLSSAIHLQQKSQELQKMITKTGSEKEEEEDEEVALPGFRFHPTDEELLGFYLRRKVDKKLLASIDALIKQIDIYKYDPWDLPKSNGAGEKEGYFFCKRGRKYRNSIRPNRVTGSGFWKATGIDKSVYSHGGEGRDCVGLKKTLVYYRGSAGKGTKTDWMMHEFRLPTNDSTTTTTTTNLANAKSSTTQEAEVWTLCRIFMRNASFRKYAPDWREIANKRTQPTSTAKLMDQAISSNININYKTSISTVDCNNYVSFGASPLFMSNIQHNNNSNVNDIININKKLASVTNQYYENNTQDRKVVARSDTAADHQQQPLSMASSSSNNISSGNDQQLLSYGDWDELRSVVDFAFDSPFL